MGKNLSLIAIVGLLVLGCSENGDLFEKISKEKSFKLKDYKEYVVGVTNDNMEGISYIGYDLNKNGKPDLIAMIKILGKDSVKYTLDQFAFAISINKNEDGIYDIYYLDRDGDGEFDTIVQNKDK